MSRFIDVLTAAATTRKIECYESALCMDVNSRRSISCIDASLKLRDKVIQALKTAGFDDSQIHEDAGNSRRYYWYLDKSVNHRILVRSTNMSTLIQGMAAVERTLDTHRPSPILAWFAPFKWSFTFEPPVPLYAPSESAAEALEHAMQRARTVADAIAQAHGQVVDGLIQVYELAAASQGSTQGHDELENSDPDIDEFQAIGPGTNYSNLEQPAGRGIRRFRVRFSLK